MSNSEKKATFPYEFVDVKTQLVGKNENTMELYAYKGKLDIDNLKQLCINKKESFVKGFFYFLVLFDDREKAGFPSDPFTAAFSDEQKYSEHIRAGYTYNTVNGYSKLKIYEPNQWANEGELKELDI